MRSCKNILDSVCSSVGMCQIMLYRELARDILSLKEWSQMLMGAAGALAVLGFLAFGKECWDLWCDQCGNWC